MKRFIAAAFAAMVLISGCSKDNVIDEPETPETPVNPDPEPAPEPDPSPSPEVSEYAPEFVCGSMEITTAGGTAITSKEDYVDCTVSLSHFNSDWNFTDVPAGIRGRGNSTWEWYPKKPYRIKFEKKQSVMGLDASKSWVLLAEYRDPTDLMNAFVFELGSRLGMPYTNHNRYVEVTLNGEFIGLYHLTEQVQQGSARVNVDEANGYLIQLDADDGPQLSPSATDNFWSSVYYMPVCVKNPDEPDAGMLRKIKSELGELENAIRLRDWDKINSLLEVKTMIDFMIIQELVYNVELAAPRSMYMHKDVDSKWAMGPLWDFDAGFDFDWGTMTTGHNYFADYRELVLGTKPSTHGGTQYEVPGFFSDLFHIPDFVAQYKSRWEEVKDMVLPAWEATLTYFNANTDPFEREADRWTIDRNYETEIGRMQSWLEKRTSYLTTVITNY